MPAITADRRDGSLVGRFGTRSADRVTVNSAGPDSDGDGPAERITVNRALQVYAYLTQLSARGGSVYVREAAESELEPLKVA